MKSLRDLRYLVMAGTLLFLVLMGGAFFLVCRNAGVMRDEITKGFNEQQLILAHQAASHIDTNLNDIEVEIESLKRLHAGGLGKSASTEAIRAAVERTRSKGVMEIGRMEAEGQITSVRDIGVAETVTPGEIAADCGLDDSGRMVLGRLLVASVDSTRSMVTGMLCTRMAFDAHPGAVLFAKMDVSRLVAGVVRDIRSGRTGHAWVIDETGTVLYHPEQGYIGKDAFTEDMERKPCVSVDQTGRVLKDRILRGDEGTGKYVSLGHRGIQGEVRGLIAFAPVRAPALSAGHVWSVAVVAPANEVAETARRMHMRHIWAEIALCAAMVMGGLTAVVYHRRTLRTRKAQATQATVEPKRQA